MKRRPRPLRRYPDEALTPENIRRVILQAAQRGAHQGFRLIERERLKAKRERAEARD
jgi:hypothetical protein